jgi:CoA:oxalate CoA-transferase
VRVLDLSRVLAGPMTGRLLSDLGADVIKLEPPDPDLLRFIAPKRDRGMSGLYTLANAGKRNICVDLARKEGREIALGLVRWADALIENFRPGVLEKLGLGWEILRGENRRLVLLSINGFGRDSALRERRAYAPIIHAMTGILQYHAEYTGGPLTQLADNQADINASLHGAIGLLAALHAAERSGEGRRVEVPLFDALLASYSETPFALLDEPVHRDECRLFDAGVHGHIAIAGPPQNAWARLRETHGLEDPAPGRVPLEAKALRRHAAMETWMAAQPSVELLLRRLEIAGLAAGRVEALGDVLHGDLAASQGLLHELDDRRGGRRPIVRTPYRIDGARCTPPRPAPWRGEHNAEVLREVLGYDDPHVAALEAAGVLQSSPDDAS